LSLPNLYLASASPRRSELLTQLNVQFSVIPQNIPEHRLINENPQEYVERLAIEKALAGLDTLPSDNEIPVLGADTTVVVDGDILGKPQNKVDAMNMLNRLSGRSHRVLSAVAVVGRDNLGQDRLNIRKVVQTNDSRVTFRIITEQEREAYWATGEPGDKAGAYAIQGLAAIFIEKIDGSYSGVMGLPLFETNELLAEFGIQVLL